MRHALRCARIEAQLTWFFQLSWRSMSSRQCKQMKGNDLTEDDHLQAMRIRVKVLEPTVAALADAATEHCWPKSASKTAVVRCAVDWVERHGRYCTRSVAAPYSRHRARLCACSLPADASLGAHRGTQLAPWGPPLPA